MYPKNINFKYIIIGIITMSIIIIGGAFYLYNKNNDYIIENQEELEVDDIKDNSIKQENNNETEKLVVYVAGAVNNEGVFELDINSRVSDAIEMAGGFREDAYIKDINLAYKLEDGMKIYIPTNNEVEEGLREEKGDGTSEVSGNIGSDSKKNSYTNIETRDSNVMSSGNENKKVNINTANQQLLETLPGIGASTAIKIINYRKDNGKFKTIEEIKNVSGIGESKFNNIKDLISV